MVSDNIIQIRKLLETLSKLSEVPTMNYVRSKKTDLAGAPVKFNPSKMKSHTIPNSIDGQRGMAMEQHISDAIEELQQIEDINKVSPEHRQAMIDMAETIILAFKTEG